MLKTLRRNKINSTKHTPTRKQRILDFMEFIFLPLIPVNDLIVGRCSTEFRGCHLTTRRWSLSTREFPCKFSHKLIRILRWRAQYVRMHAILYYSRVEVSIVTMIRKLDLVLLLLQQQYQTQENNGFSPLFSCHAIKNTSFQWKQY